MTSKTTALCCPVVELRQYLMVPGRRDVLIALFEREFVESQETAGARVIGTFRDLDRPDRFVWMRGFAGMEQRARALTDFYAGPTWKAHREAANATMIDSDDVLLLKPPSAHAGFDLPAARAPVGTTSPGKGLITANLWYLQGDETGFADQFEKTFAPLLAGNGSAPIAWFIGEHAVNTFPALPVRAGERLMAWFAAFNGPEAHAAASRSLTSEKRWTAAYAQISRRFARPPETLRLEPTARSLLQR